MANLEARVDEFLYMHLGRDDATLYLLKVGDEQTVSFNGCLYHGSWRVDGDMLHMRFHCRGDVAYAKDHSVMQVGENAYQSMIPSKPVRMVKKRIWMLDHTNKLQPVWDAAPEALTPATGGVDPGDLAPPASGTKRPLEL